MSVSAALRCVMVAAVAGALLPPDNTGLVGFTPERDNPPSLNFWFGAPKPPVRPRKKDLHEPTLMKLMGPDFDARWMRRAHTPMQTAPPVREEERQSVVALQQLVAQLSLPEALPEALRPALRSWLVSRASCPITFTWTDLGVEFWPRWVRRGRCAGEDEPPHLSGIAGSASASSSYSSSYSGGASRRGLSGLLSDDDDELDADEGLPQQPPPRQAPQQANASDAQAACSWPPGMACVPGAARNLHILRWHCRLRKSLETSNKVWTAERLRKEVERRRRRRKKYRCLWLKVPYPVPEDCVCACS